MSRAQAPTPERGASKNGPDCAYAQVDRTANRRVVMGHGKRTAHGDLPDKMTFFGKGSIAIFADDIIFVKGQPID